VPVEHSPFDAPGRSVSRKASPQGKSESEFKPIWAGHRPEIFEVSLDDASPSRSRREQEPMPCLLRYGPMVMAISTNHNRRLE
jgi:hypothetical protein